MERDLRAQLSELEESRQQQNHNSDDGEWRRRYKDLERELGEQQQVTEEVRREASQFLQEMRALSSRSDHALEKEERLSNQVSALEAELKEWKSRYARTKTQIRTLRASSMGLAMQSPDAANYTRDAAFATPDGLVKDVHVTKFQLSIDELLQVARKSEPHAVLECMKNVVVCIRNITSDIDAASGLSPAQSMNGSVNGDGAASSLEKQQVKLKSRVSATANNLITASKNHASAAGLSPVSLLDAAASHLTTAIVELVKLVKIRPTPTDELEDEEEEDDRPMPLGAGYSSYGSYGSSGINGAGHLRHRSRGSIDSGGYGSSTGSPRRLDGSWASRRSEEPGLVNGIGGEKESGLVEFKVSNFSDNTTVI